MTAIYSVEKPDGARTYYTKLTPLMSGARSLSKAVEGTVIIRAHVLRDIPKREMAAALLNGNAFQTESVVGWFYNGKRRPMLETPDENV